MLEEETITTKETTKVRINRAITAVQVRLIAEDGEQVGIVSIREAITRAETAELDLVEIAPQAKPPVCRIMDYGKYKFEQSKRSKQKSKRIQIKEIKLRPVTEVGDYNVKLKKAIAFLEEGDKVKFSVRFKGREMAYQQHGVDILRRVEQDLKEYGSVEQYPKLEGRQLVMLIGPQKKT